MCLRSFEYSRHCMEMDLTDTQGQMEADNKGLGIKTVTSTWTELWTWSGKDMRVFLRRQQEGREEAESSHCRSKGTLFPMSWSRRPRVSSFHWAQAPIIPSACACLWAALLGQARILLLWPKAFAGNILIQHVYEFIYIIQSLLAFFFLFVLGLGSELWLQ